MRKDKLVTGEVYHVLNKSIAGYEIFNNKGEFSRIFNTIRYYQRTELKISFSQYIRPVNDKFNDFFRPQNEEKLIEIICYCLMPTHLHFILKQVKEDGISTFMSNTQNSYSKYFNIKHKRKGPLWESRFKNILVKTDEQLLHLTRYIHLNPATAYLVNKPEEWIWSSYHEYIRHNGKNDICRFDKILDIEPSSYKKFVEDRISYQRDLAKIKELLLE